MAGAPPGGAPARTAVFLSAKATFNERLTGEEMPFLCAMKDGRWRGGEEGKNERELFQSKTG